MKIGDQVISKIYPEYKVGKILKINDLGDESYCEIFFDEIKDVITLNVDSLSKFSSNIEKMSRKDYDDPLLFEICLLCEKIKTLSYQDKMISANNFNIIPLPHQILTVNRVMDEFEPRWLICDEVGLGKTIEAALVFEELKLRNMAKRVLIVCPSGLTNQWKDELKTKFNEDFVIFNRETFKGLTQLHNDKNIWEEFDQIITSIDFIKTKEIKEELAEKTIENRKWHNRYVSEDVINGNWDLVIIDEAHNLSKDWDGSETSRYKIGKELAVKTPMLLLLTATPHQGKSERFRHLLELIDPYKFYDESSVTIENVKSVTVKNEKRAVTDLDGNFVFKDRIVQMVEISREKDNIETLLYNEVSEYVANYHLIASESPVLMLILIMYQKMVSSSSRAIYHSLKKRYELLLTDANAIENLEKLNFEDLEEFAVENAYEKFIMNHSNNEVSEINIEKLKPLVANELRILESCLKLAKEASTGRQDTKVEKLIEIIDNVISREGVGTKFIIFTEFIKTQEYIGEVLEYFGYEVAYFNGNMSLEDKIINKTKFKEECQFLISTDSGGEGINLQFAHVIINYDLPWNPMKIEQRIGRIDRIGQNKDVLVFNFVIKDTVEEHIREILDNKLNVIADEFGDDKKRDVLSLLNEEYNFDNIFIEAIKARKVKEKQLQKIGNEMYTQAKEVIENQQLLIPFSEEDGFDEKIEDVVVEDERVLIEKLVKSYLNYKNIELIEYSKNKNVFYVEKPIGGIKYRNIVFDKKIALENEKYSYINISHPLIKLISDEMTLNDSLSFDIKITNYKSLENEIKGNLFFYMLTLTNNEDFIRKKIIPIFINQMNKYDEVVSEWFEHNNDFKIKMDFKEDINISIEDIELKAEEIKNQKVKEHLINAKFELNEKIDKEKEKFDKYFENKEKEINKHGIENIKLSKVKKLKEHQERIEFDMKKRINLVPQIELFAVAEITFK